MATLTFYGLDEMSQYLLKNANPERRQRVLKKYGSELKENAIGKAQFSGKYTTGATRRSITLEAGGDRAVVTAHTKYSGYLEVGTRKMAAQPFMAPALEATVPGMVEELAKWE